MRVTVVLFSANIAGGTRVILMIADQLRRRGHEVLFVFPPPPRLGWKARLKSVLTGKRLTTVSPDTSYFDQLGVDVKYKALESHRPVADADVPDADVVVATFWVTAEWVARLSPRKGAKAYFIQQYEANFGFPKDRVDATWRLPVQKIVCSGWLADLARDQFGDPSAVVVQNGVDTSLFHAPPRGKQAHPTVGFLYEPKAVVKGTGVALKVLESVGRRIPNLRVRAFGSVDLDPRFPLPALSEFTSRPRQNDLRAIYAGCDAWLCTSTSEGFHLPPHEAMACRCPVVSTKVGGPTDLVTDGVNGYLTEVGDVDRLADGLVKVLAADDAAWRQMSDAAYSVATGFTWERAAGLFETALREAIMREVHPPVV